MCKKKSDMVVDLVIETSDIHLILKKNKKWLPFILYKKMHLRKTKSEYITCY